MSYDNVYKLSVQVKSRFGIQSDLSTLGKCFIHTFQLLQITLFVCLFFLKFISFSSSLQKWLVELADWLVSRLVGYTCFTIDIPKITNNEISPTEFIKPSSQKIISVLIRGPNNIQPDTDLHLKVCRFMHKKTSSFY